MLAKWPNNKNPHRLSTKQCAYPQESSAGQTKDVVGGRQCYLGSVLPLNCWLGERKGTWPKKTTEKDGLS